MLMKYKITLAVGRPNRTWFETEVNMTSEDHGDTAAIDRAIAEVQETYNMQNYAVSFITLMHYDAEEVEMPDKTLSSYRGWLRAARKYAAEKGLTFEMATARVAFQKDYTPAGLVDTFGYPERGNDEE